MNIGVFANPKTKATQRLEISNNEEFIERVRQINAEAREQNIKWPIRHWKIRHLGDNGKTPAAIQKLIDQSNRTDDSPQLTHEKDDEIGQATAKAMDKVLTDTEPKNLTEKIAVPGMDEALLPETTNTVVEPVRDNIEGEVKPREKPRINPFTGEPQ
jgi:hypothetical protein